MIVLRSNALHLLAPSDEGAVTPFNKGMIAAGNHYIRKFAALCNTA
jgi:hypothetical protein